MAKYKIVPRMEKSTKGNMSSFGLYQRKYFLYIFPYWEDTTILGMGKNPDSLIEYVLSIPGAELEGMDIKKEK